MSHLFGKKEYIDNLRDDVIKIQECLIDIVSRTGPQKFISWKYPDKVHTFIKTNILLLNV